MRFETIEEQILATIAEYLSCKPDELGQEWVSFASAVEAVIALPCGTSRVNAIGRLCIAAVELPDDGQCLTGRGPKHGPQLELSL